MEDTCLAANIRDFLVIQLFPCHFKFVEAISRSSQVGFYGSFPCRRGHRQYHIRPRLYILPQGIAMAMHPFNSPFEYMC